MPVLAKASIDSTSRVNNSDLSCITSFPKLTTNPNLVGPSMLERVANYFAQTILNSFSGFTAIVLR